MEEVYIPNNGEAKLYPPCPFISVVVASDKVHQGLNEALFLIFFAK